MLTINKLLEEKDSNIWNIPSILELDHSVTKYDYVTIYEDTHGTADLDNVEEFSFTSNNEDIWIVPSDSYLIVNAKLVKNDGTDYNYVAIAAAGGNDAVAADDVSYDLNAFNMFREVRYYADDSEVERIDYVGYSTMLYNLNKYVSYGDVSSVRDSQLVGTSRNTVLTLTRRFRGELQFLLPIKKMFPIWHQVDHAFRGLKHRITLTKNISSSTITKAAGTPAGKILIKSIEWKIPHVEPSLQMMSKLESMLSKQSIYNISWIASNVYRFQPPRNQEIRVPLAATIHKPRNIYVMFQNVNRTNSQLNCSMFFDHMNVEYVNVEINSLKFPDKNIECDFTANQEKCMEMFQRFLDSCPGGTSIEMSYRNFLSEFPIFHIDVSNHKPELYDNSSFPNIVINVKFDVPPGHDYIMWVIIENERQASLNMESRKMRIIK